MNSHTCLIHRLNATNVNWNYKLTDIRQDNNTWFGDLTAFLINFHVLELYALSAGKQLPNFRTSLIPSSSG